MDLTSVISKLWLTLVQVWLQLTLRVIARFDFISEETYYVSNENLMYITGVFLYLNSTINPIIYNVISAKYRKAFKETLFTPSKCCRYADKFKLSIFVESLQQVFSNHPSMQRQSWLHCHSHPASTSTTLHACVFTRPNFGPCICIQWNCTQPAANIMAINI